MAEDATNVTEATREHSSRGMAAFFAVCSLASLGLLIVVMYQNTHPEWRAYQEEFKELAIATAKTKAAALLKDAQESGGDVEAAKKNGKALIAAAEGIPVALEGHQLVLKDLKRIDRCTVCHLGMEGGVVDLGPAPTGGSEGKKKEWLRRKVLYDAHPGDYLKDHNLATFGCTSCHDGQGRATNSREAHALAHEDKAKGPIYWERPMLKQPFIQANCLKCHTNNIPKTAPLLARGKQVFEQAGCLGCHQQSGKGGSRGPGLDGLADASKHVKHVVKKNAKHYLGQTDHNHNIAYILEAVHDPKAQPTDSKMIKVDLSKDDELALTIYLKGLTKERISSSHLPAGYGAVAKADGHSLYMKYCSACHGKEGEGETFEELAKKPPRLGSPAFLSIAPDRLLTRIIETGKQGSVMPPWATTGGLTAKEIALIAGYIRSWQPDAIPYTQVVQLQGSAKAGSALFASNCAGCHGYRGRPGGDVIGTSLNNEQFLAVASDEFIYRTIVNGRAETAMPSWRYFTPQELADMMAYIRGWRRKPTPLPAFLAKLEEAKANPREIGFGKSIYRKECASCHGVNGNGGIGPSLDNQEFLSIADDKFLYGTLTRGRPETAMPSFTYLGDDSLASLMVFLRSWQKVASVKLSDRKVYGSDLLGKKIFEDNCVQCHGTYGQGGVGSAILRKGFLDVASDHFIRRMIQKGRGDTAMVAMGKGEHGVLELSDYELDSLVAFMRSRQKAPVDIPITRRFRGSDEDLKGSLARGKLLYVGGCAGCHGTDGGGLNGPALGNPAFLKNATDGYIMAIAILGRDNTGMIPQGKGPDGSAGLTSKQIVDVTNYIRSWQGRTDTPPRTIQKADGGIDVVRGEVLYAQNCAGCHGDTGNEGFAPALNNEDFLAVVPDGYLQATLAMGRPGTPMRSVMERSHGMAQLNARQINDIIVFLRAKSAGGKERKTRK